MMVKVMADRPLGEGELRGQQRRRRRLAMFAAFVAAGFAMGFGLSRAEGDGLGPLEGPIPAWVALLLSVAWLAVTIGGTLWYRRTVDEHDLVANGWSMAMAGSVLLLAYPVWWLLWRGDIAREPSAHILFIAAYLVALVAYIWKKYR